MTIWVDADACPKVIKDILFRAAERAQVPTVLVANRALHVPPSPWVRALQVPRGFDVADDEIMSRVAVGDLVVTQDIPLASTVLKAGAKAVTPRGELMTPDTIGERLAMRDFLDTMRASGVQTGGPSTLGPSERQAFARELDRYLAGLPRV